MTYQSMIAFLLAAEGDPSFVVYLTAIGAFAVALATAGGVIWNIQQGRRKARLEDKQQDTTIRTVTFDEMESAIPGLSSLVKLYQEDSEKNLLDNIKLREQQLEDHRRIIELEDQVRALQNELVAEKKKNIRLEERIQELEGRGRR